jgi:integrase
MDGMVAACLTQFDIIVRLKDDLAVTPARRRDLISAVRRICKIVGVDPRITPASLQFMRPLINKVRPAKHRLRPKTWANLCSNFRAALVHALPRPPRQPDPAWERLRTALPNGDIRKGLSRFIGFCERERIPSEAVCDAVIAQFLVHLESDTLVPDPRACLRRTCRLWNAATDTAPGWPQVRVTLPSHRRPRRTLPLSSYPVELQEELSECLAPPRRGHRFAEDGHKKVLRPSTVRKITVEVELALSAIVEAGRDPASITSLKCLFELEAFEIILRRYLKDDDDQTPRPTARNLASTLIGLTKRTLGSGPAALEQIAELRRLQKCLGPQPKRLTVKNRRLLLELSDPFVRAKLLLLPEQLAEWAARATPVRGAVAMELALAIAILLAAPMRIANLAGLRPGQHLLQPGGSRSLWLIDIPEIEVKNRVRLVYELPQRVTTVVNRFLRDFRPVLAEAGNPYLFPVGSTHKSPPVLSQQIRWVIADWVGVDMTAHQFRHFAGLLMSDDLGALADLLGDKDIETVRSYYSELNTLFVGRRFDAIIEAEIIKARPRRQRRS